MKYLIFDTETSGLPKTKIINPQSLNLWCHIVQFSYIIYDDKLNKIIKIRDNIIKINDEIIISEETTNINGITNKICQEKGINLNTLINEFFEDLLISDLLIGHNIEFDLNMLKVELLRNIYKNNIIIDIKKINNKNDNINNNIEKDLNNNNVKNINDDIDRDNYKYYLYVLNNYKNIYCTMENSIQLCNIEKINSQGKSYLKFPKLIELHKKLFNSEPNNLHNSLNDILITLRCFIKMKYNNDINITCKDFQKLNKKNKLL